MKPYKLETSFNLLLPGFPTAASSPMAVFNATFPVPIQSPALARGQLPQSAVWDMARPTRECGGLSGPVRPPQPSLQSPLLNILSIHFRVRPLDAEQMLLGPQHHTGCFAERTSFYPHDKTAGYLLPGLQGQGGSDRDYAVQPQIYHSPGVTFPFTFVHIGSPYYCP